MFKNSGSGIINKLSLRGIRAGIGRYFILVCAIILTTILFTTIFTIGSNTIDAFQRYTMMQSGGDGHAALRFIDNATYESVAQHPLINDITYECILADSIENPELNKRQGELWYKDAVSIRLRFLELQEGAWPVAEDEIATDIQTLELLGIEPTIGSLVPLYYTVNGVTKQKAFTLSGYWISEQTDSKSMFLTSKAYLDSNPDVYSHDRAAGVVTGSIISVIKFSSSTNIEDKLAQVISDSGYEPYDETNPNYVDSTVMWTYLSSNLSGHTGTLISLAILLLLISVTGYLIIYNVLHIAIAKEIQSYGLLKTIGATARQCMSIVRRRTVFLCIIGIPIGICIGYAVGIVFVPSVLARASVEINYTPRASAWIFLGSAVFSMLTVSIGMSRPMHYLKKLSPIEAYKTVESSYSRKSKSKTGSKITRMALSNVRRNKKKTFTVLASLSLCIILLCCVTMIAQSFDLDKYVSKFVDTDFYVADTSFFNFKYQGLTDTVSNQFVEEVEQADFFEEGGGLYFNQMQPVTTNYEVLSNNHALGPGDNPLTALYGIDEFPMTRLEIIEGAFDIGPQSIIEGIRCDDNGNPLQYSPFKIGDTVELNYFNAYDDINPSNTEKFRIVAKVKITATNSARVTFTDFCFYLPSSTYNDFTNSLQLMSYMFNSSNLPSSAEFLKEYTTNIEPTLDYESKTLYTEEFEATQRLVTEIGTLLSIVIGIIGLLNFINTVMMSISARRNELSLLECVGMTKRQIYFMLSLEGILYSLGTFVISFIVSCILSILVLRGIIEQIWFMSFQFDIIPVLVAFPIMIIFAVMVSASFGYSTLKQPLSIRVRPQE